MLFSSIVRFISLPTGGMRICVYADGCTTGNFLYSILFIHINLIIYQTMFFFFVVVCVYATTIVEIVPVYNEQ